MTNTPLKSGFFMPAEWEKHSAVWLVWPHDEITFPDGRIKKVEKIYVEIIKHLHESEDVELLVLNEKMKSNVTEMLARAGVDALKITLHITDYADVWIRDYGPTFIKNPETRELAWIKWQYNAYNNKFPQLIKDNEVFFALRKDIDKRMFEPGILMEGGAIEVNGQGTALTTEQCLLSRNPKLSKNEIEKLFKDYLGIKKIIWLKQGLPQDHTDGHMDELARFVSPNKILCAYEENQTDENFKILEANYQSLIKSTDNNNKPFEVVKLPVPHIIYDSNKPFEAEGKAPASYTNFYIGNEVVLASVFKDVNDQRALETLQSCFPNHKVIPIDCSDVIYGGGGVHCMTQQQPV